MERLIIVIDCPDDWRERNWIDPKRVQEEIERTLDRLLPVRVRWQTMVSDG